MVVIYVIILSKMKSSRVTKMNLREKYSFFEAHPCLFATFTLSKTLNHKLSLLLLSQGGRRGFCCWDMKVEDVFKFIIY